MSGLGLYEKLDILAKSDVYPFHMPGHKRITAKEDSPYAYDITEIDGFDNLHHPRGILKDSMDMASEFYGTKRTYYLVNGSTSGILSAISACTSQGGSLLMARNCHKSVYNAAFQKQLTTYYVYPRDMAGKSVAGGIHPKDVEDMLATHSDIEAVIITSPTYEGVVSYVSAIAKIVHRYNIPLIVDEAHGAHFSMHKDFPATAIECGADVVIQSVHKTLPSLTQTALLHICSDLVDVDRIETYLGIYQSSSPSYVLMASIDKCIRDILDRGQQDFDRYVNLLQNFREKAAVLTNIKLLDRSILGKGGAFDLDIGKLVFSIVSDRYTGYDIYKQLLDKYHIQLEMASSDYIIAMTSVSDSEEGYDRLYDALVEIDRDIRINEGYKAMASGKYGTDSVSTDVEQGNEPYRKVVVCKPIYEAMNAETEMVEFKSATGRIAAEYVYLYPPGIPVIVPGEIVDSISIEYLLKCKSQGLEVQGQKDDELTMIKVIKEDWKEFSYGENILPDGEKLLGEGYHI